MAPRLFGTDGMRGRAGQWPLDPVTVRRLGAAIVRVLDASSSAPRLLIGRDTRESGEWIERELAYGARLAGASVTAGGVLPTPAVAYITRTSDVSLGAVISGIAQSLRRQRHQGLLGRRSEVHRGSRAPGRGRHRGHVVGAAGRRRARNSRRRSRRAATARTCETCSRRPAGSPERGSSSTAPTARPPVLPRGSLPSWASTSS